LVASGSRRTFSENDAAVVVVVVVVFVVVVAFAVVLVDDVLGGSADAVMTTSAMILIVEPPFELDLDLDDCLTTLTGANGALFSSSPVSALMTLILDLSTPIPLTENSPLPSLLPLAPKLVLVPWE